MRGRTVWKCHVITTLAVIAASTASARAQLVNTGTTTTTTTTTTSTLSGGTTIVPPITSGPKRGAAHVIEWDLPAGMDFSPGAVAVDTRGEDNNRAWFVTRFGTPEDTPAGRKVYRFDFGPSLMKNGGAARWTSWDLAPEVDQNNGGVA